MHDAARLLMGSISACGHFQVHICNVTTDLTKQEAPNSAVKTFESLKL